MDKVKMYEALIKAKRDLIEATTDEGKLKALNEELMELADMKAEAKAEAKYDEERKAAEAKAKEEEEAKALKEENKKAKDFGRVEVTKAGPYKGVSLKAVVKNFRDRAGEEVKKQIDADYETAEKLAKRWTDMTLTALKDPSRGEKAMTEGTTTAGGYLVPSDERMELLSYMRENSVALNRCRVENMTSDTMTFPVENANVTVSYRSEGSSVTATSATFTQATLSAKQLDAYVPVSKELVMDAASTPALVAMLMSQFNEAVAKKIDSTVFTGTGDPVSGVFINPGYSEVFSAGSAAFSMLLFSNITSAIGKTFATVQDTSRLAWYGHPTPIWQHVKGLTDDNGQPILSDPRGGAGASGTIYGWPMEFVHQAPSASAASKAWLAFGDLTGFLIGERLSNMSLFYDPYGDAYNGNDRFFLFTRWAFANALNKKWCTIETSS